MKKICLGILFNIALLSDVSAIVINPSTQSLYLGNNNVSCGRYTLTDNSRLSDVKSFCSIVGSTSASDGKLWLRINTRENGAVDCSFIGDHLNQCFSDD